MSERQDLAEQGAMLCVAGMGLAGLATPILSAAVPLIVLFTIAADAWRNCDRHKRKQAIAEAERRLQAGGFTDRGISSALALLRENRDTQTLDARVFNTAEARRDIPGTMLAQLQATGQVPQDDRVPEALYVVFEATFQAMRDETSFSRILTQEYLAGLEQTLTEWRQESHQSLRALETQVEVSRTENRDGHDLTQAMLAKLVAHVETDPKHKQEVERQRQLVAALAARYLEATPTDFDTALTGLERALDVAAAERDRLPGNVSDAVETVLDRVRTLNSAGQVDSAEDALWQELQRAEAAQLQLIEKGLQQVVLTRNVDRAVTLELRRHSLERGGFAELQSKTDEWFKRGDYQGLSFDLEVASQLANELRRHSETNTDRAMAEIMQSACLQVLGDRTETVSLLQDAVEAGRSALAQLDKTATPQSAKANLTLGNSLLALARHETGTDRLFDAVDCYRAAMEGWPRDKAPMDWARAQNNMGNARAEIARRDRNIHRLKQSITAYRSALEEWTQTETPMEWSIAHSNLAASLHDLALREDRDHNLDLAVQSCLCALEALPRQRVPLIWAQTQAHLGRALCDIGELGQDADKLRQARTHLHAALEEQHRDKVPLTCAATMCDLANMELMLYRLTQEIGSLDAAERHANAALHIMEEHPDMPYKMRLDKILEAILSDRNQLAGAPSFSADQ